MEEKKYINIDNMATRLCQILKDARESMVDDENKDFIMENFSDEYLEDYSNVMAWQFNSDMKKYLHNPDHRICGNFNNIDYDYPYHIYGEVTYDTPLVNAMIARLDAGEDMLFGVGRDIAQVELELYILCQIILGIGWDANKMGKWFWQSNKDRDLVILKNWITVEK